MFSALFVYSKFTKLGDTKGYLSGLEYDLSSVFLNSTHMMSFLGHSLSFFLGPTFANLPFVFLSIYGIFYAVKRLKLNNRELFFLLAILSFPSFGIWTSIASKEAMAVFFMGIILGFIIDVIKRNPKKNYFLVVIAFYLCTIFKPQYLIGIGSLILFHYVCRKFSLNGIGKLALLGLFFILSFFSLYIFRHEINELSFMMPIHFSLEAGSTRENTIWLDDFDVFWNAPYGMFISFFGPTVNEALAKPTHLFAFIESLFIILLFFYGLLKLTLMSINTGRLNVYYLGIFLTAALWILFVHYPFGALNPGSAIRYREAFYAFLVILFYFGYTEVKRRYHIEKFKIKQSE
jgi:hypothetical protein